MVPLFLTVCVCAGVWQAPTEDGLVLDVEVAMKVGPEPVLATAAAPGVWYSWIAPHLLDATQPPTVRSAHCLSPSHTCRDRRMRARR
jgi:hypothetical protein